MRLDRKHLTRKFDRYYIGKWTVEDPQEKFEVKKVNEEKGKGLFAKIPFVRQDFLLFYRGEKITAYEYTKLCEEGKNEYAFALQDHNLYIDAADESSGLARYINDCGEERPNARPKVWHDGKGNHHIMIVAERNIEPGEEILYDYGGDFLPWRIPKGKKPKVASGYSGSNPTEPYGSVISGIDSENDSERIEDEVSEDENPPELLVEDTPPPPQEPVFIKFPLHKPGEKKHVALPARRRGPTPEEPSVEKSPEAVTDDTLNPCLHCGFPITFVDEIVVHQVVCPVKPFFDDPIDVNGKRRHYFVSCVDCNAVTNKFNYFDMKKHIEKDHQKASVAGKSYIVYSVNVDTKEVSYPQPMNSGIELPEAVIDPDYVPERHHYCPSETESSSSESENEERNNTEPEPEPKEKAFKCEFCMVSFKNRATLRRHFQNFHHITDKNILNLIQKCHLMSLKGKPKSRFLCTKCLTIHDAKFRHSDRSHEPVWKKVKSLWDLPDSILKQAQVNNEEKEDKWLNKTTFNFGKLLKKYEQMRKNQMVNNKGNTFSEGNMRGKINRIKTAIITTRGMTTVSRLEEWIAMYPKVQAGKSVTNMLRDLKNFIEHFLCYEIGSFQRKVDIEAFKSKIMQLMDQENRPNRSRRNISQKADANTLPQVQDVLLMRNRMLEYLEATLKEDTTELAEDDFRTVTLNLVGLMILRNNSRAGTVSLFRTEFLENYYYSESLQLYAIELAPKGLENIKKGPGERERIAALQKILEKTHKNFYCEGIKVQALTEREMIVFQRFARVRQQMNKDHVYLFAPFNVAERHTHETQKNYTRYWSSICPKQHGLPNLRINATQYRKLMASDWKEKICNPLHRDALNKHTGHSAETARNFYEVQVDKLRNAAMASQYTEMTLQQCSSSQVPMPAFESRLTALFQPALQSSVIETQIPLQAQELGSQEDNVHPESELDSESEVSIEEWEEDEDSEDEMFVPPNNRQQPKKAPETKPQEVSVRRKIDMNLILNLIKTRDQRHARQKYTLTEEDNQKLAALYIEFIEKRGNFSASFRDKNLPINIDAAKSIFKQVTKKLEA